MARELAGQACEAIGFDQFGDALEPGLELDRKLEEFTPRGLVKADRPGHWLIAFWQYYLSPGNMSNWRYALARIGLLWRPHARGTVAGGRDGATPMDLTYSEKYRALQSEVRAFIARHGHLSPKPGGGRQKPSPKALEWQ